MEFITAKQLSENKEEFLILDIRDEFKFRNNHIPESRNIDVYNDVHEGNYDEIKEKLKVLPKEKIIVTVCNAGVTAQPASKLLEEMGYRTAVLEKGMIGWNKEKLA